MMYSNTIFKIFFFIGLFFMGTSLVSAQNSVVISNEAARDTGQGNIVVTWNSDIPVQGFLVYDKVSHQSGSEYKFKIAESKELATLHGDIISGLSTGTYYVRPVIVFNSTVLYGKELTINLTSQWSGVIGFLLHTIPPATFLSSYNKTPPGANSSSGLVTKPAGAPASKKEPIVEKKGVPAVAPIAAKEPVLTYPVSREDLLETSYQKNPISEDKNIIGPIFAASREIWSFFSVVTILVLAVLGLVALLVLRRN